MKTELQNVLDAIQAAKANAVIAKNSGDRAEARRQNSLKKSLEQEAILLGYVAPKKAPRLHRRVSRSW